VMPVARPPINPISALVPTFMPGRFSVCTLEG
jgi:hypothetical protein